MTDRDDPGPSVLRRLVGVYDADGSLRGELSYWIGARLGRRHCALCDVTHGLVRPRSDWSAHCDALPVPFDTHHRDDQPDDIRRIIGDQLPAVVAETSGGSLLLLGPDELEGCAGSVEALAAAIESALAQAGVRWP